MICPTCQQDTLDPGLRVNMDAHEMVFMGERRALSPDQTKLLAALHRRFAHLVSYETIEAILWGERADGGPDVGDKVIHTQMCYLRRKLKGWPFLLLNHHSTGYSLCRAETAVTDGGLCKATKEVISDKEAA